MACRADTPVWTAAAEASMVGAIEAEDVAELMLSDQIGAHEP